MLENADYPDEFPDRSLLVFRRNAERLAQLHSDERNLWAACPAPQAKRTTLLTEVPHTCPDFRLQYMISAKAGLVNYVDGQVNVRLHEQVIAGSPFEIRLRFSGNYSAAAVYDRRFYIPSRR